MADDAFALAFVVVHAQVRGSVGDAWARWCVCCIFPPLAPFQLFVSSDIVATMRDEYDDDDKYDNDQ